MNSKNRNFKLCLSAPSYQTTFYPKIQLFYTYFFFFLIYNPNYYFGYLQDPVDAISTASKKAKDFMKDGLKMKVKYILIHITGFYLTIHY